MSDFIVCGPSVGFKKTDLTGPVRSAPCQQRHDHLAHNCLLFHRDCPDCVVSFLFRGQEFGVILNIFALSLCDQPGLHRYPGPYRKPDSDESLISKNLF